MLEDALFSPRSVLRPLRQCVPDGNSLARKASRAAFLSRAHPAGMAGISGAFARRLYTPYLDPLSETGGTGNPRFGPLPRSGPMRRIGAGPLLVRQVRVL